MRVVLVGTARERQELRERSHDSAFDVVAEFDSLADARASGLRADAIVLAPPRTSIEDDDSTVTEPLTPRELQVLELVAEGLGNRAIAERLGISDQTVKFHVASISGKLGAVNRTDAVRRAVQRGVIAL
jgi:DNA-binding NarL/FixJ family response regulator